MASDGEATFGTKAGVDAAEDWAQKMSAFDPRPEDLEEAALFLEGSIQSRTLAGMDAHGRPFAPYSPLYVKEKGSSHVNLLGLGGGPHMIQSLQAQVTLSPPTIAVNVVGDEKTAMKARIHNEGLTLTGRKASSWIKKQPKQNDPRVLKLRRKLKQSGSLTVIPKREWLAVTSQDLQQMAERVVKSIMDRVARANRSQLAKINYYLRGLKNDKS